MDGSGPAKFRALPSVQSLLEQAEAAGWTGQFGRAATLGAVRAAVDAARTAIRDGGATVEPAAMLAAAGAQLQAARPGLVRVINATGVILHTNLGRAPLPDEAVAAVLAAAGYCTLEYEVAAGGRGSRMQGVEPLLREVTGAEAGLAVNNCAAAVLLALSGLAGGGEVVVSRGELVEIGGGFRIPDVIRQGGARLVEVGTTNKTRLADYRAAIGPETRVLLKVHQSNFRMTGFTEAVSIEALAGLAREHGLFCVHDLGSGALGELAMGEMTAAAAVAAGADAVAFSGDKLMGGPQAGLLVGREAAIEKMRRHPLLRAVRLDKMSIAALEAVLRLHASDAVEQVPVLRMMHQGVAAVRARAERVAAQLGGYAVVEQAAGFAGGGTLPDQPIASAAVRLDVKEPGADALAARLRAGRPPIVGRIGAGAVLLDMLTVADAEVEAVVAGVREALAG